MDRNLTRYIKYNLGQNCWENSGLGLCNHNYDKLALVFVQKCPPPPLINVARQNKACKTWLYQHWLWGGRGWLLEWNIEGVVGKVTPSFKDSQPFLSKIVVTKNVPRPVKPTVLPKQSWKEVAVDLAGPLPSGEYLLVLVGYYSRWIEVDGLQTATSKSIIHCLDAQFAKHGLPKGLLTDNGSNLLSKLLEISSIGLLHAEWSNLTIWIVTFCSIL